jgi:hypothetical protein
LRNGGTVCAKYPGKTLSSKIPTTADTSKGRLYYATPDLSNTEEWFAGYYPIADMWVEDLELIFYHDTLFSIKCKGLQNLTEALQLKYGQPTITRKLKEIKCINGLGITNSETEETIFAHYLTTSKNIQAWETAATYFDNSCTKQYLNYFIIQNTATNEKVLKQEELTKKKAQDIKSEDRKKKLSNF